MNSCIERANQARTRQRVAAALRTGAVVVCIALGLACARPEHVPPARRQPSRASPAPQPPTPPRQQRMLALIDAVDRVYAQRYAPAQFKREHFGWDRRTEIERLRRRVLDEPDLGLHAFQRALYTFVRSMRDLHTDVTFAGDRGVWLGVRVQRVGERHLVSCVDRAHVSEAAFPFDVGDEVVTFGGADIARAIEHAAAQGQYGGTPGLQQTLAEVALTYRTRREWDAMPAIGDRIELTVRRGDRPARSATLSWLDDAIAPPRASCPLKPAAGHLPPLGTPIWRPRDPQQFATYAFESGGKRYGYLRFHSYALDAPSRLEALAQLDRAVDRFRALGVRKLVIDQTRNGGGNYLFAYALFSRFTRKPLPVPLQHYLVRDGTVVGWGHRDALRALTTRLDEVRTDADAARFLSTDLLLADPLNFRPKRASTVADLREFFAWFEGQTAVDGHPRLTEPFWQLQRQIDPLPIGTPFDGPILLLVDELDISAAEYAAAALKDSGRARVLGATTSGAGGDQRKLVAGRVCGAPRDPMLDELQPCISPELSALMHELGVEELSYTITLGRRTGGAVIENRGIEPHRAYQPTESDLRTGHRAYRDEILGTLDSL
jgi:C-terminal processing protease CtpA/Prc